jgi:hypothetical protein
MCGPLLSCRGEPSLDDLLAEDEVMTPVLKSAGLDRDEIRELLLETARRRANYPGGEGLRPR